jgi:dipeptidyl aminopeptidase/acylaminoacyl peptidase
MLVARRSVSEATQKTEGFPMRRFDLRRWQACGLALCFLFCAASAHAIIREVDPGEMPALKADEGLLVVAIDSELENPAIRIEREGFNLDARTVRGKGNGRSFTLLALPAGRYRWSRIGYYGRGTSAVSKGAELSFEVKSGVLNYAGDVRLSNHRWLSVVHVSNRGLASLDWLEQTHAAVLRQWPFQYTGRYPDPFPSMYRDAIAGSEGIRDRTLDPPATEALPLPLSELWRPGRLQSIELNPRGDMFAEVVRYEVDTIAGKVREATETAKETKTQKEWRWGVNLVDIASGDVTRLYDSLKPLSRLDWAGDRSLIMSIGADSGLDVLIATHAVDGASGRRYEKVVLSRPGYLVQVLRDRPGRILFATAGSDGAEVHDIDLRDQKAVDRFDFTTARNLSEGVKDGLWFIADASGRVRLVIRRNKDRQLVLMHGGDGVFREAMVLEDDGDFRPIGLSPDGAMIYGTAERDRGQRDLVELDPATGSVTRTLFSKPDRDVVRALYAADGSLIGATYRENGLEVSDYFLETDGKVYAKLRDAFPGMEVTVIQRNADGRKMLVLAGGSDKPSQVYFHDMDVGAVSSVSEIAPWLSKQRFAPATVLHAKSADGLTVEAYLTIPLDARGKVPLVLFPHGGPIGVRDTRYFDPEVQFLASLGYAVLQVNFRGSEGFGTAFRKAGERSYGSAIEDDIDAALVKALAEHPIDADRMCALGGSYGGYSAMVSAIRWPGRFRCVVSIAGISDRALFFTASDSALAEKTRKQMEQMIGDPNTEMDEMIRYSPLYRYKELTPPMMLVHGREDLRVDFEHTRRLVRMLNLAGRPPVLIDLKDEGHSIADDGSRTRVWTGIAGFLRQHLGDPLSAQGAAKPTP